MRFTIRWIHINYVYSSCFLLWLYCTFCRGVNCYLRLCAQLRVSLGLFLGGSIGRNFVTYRPRTAGRMNIPAILVLTINFSLWRQIKGLWELTLLKFMSSLSRLGGVKVIFTYKTCLLAHWHSFLMCSSAVPLSSDEPTLILWIVFMIYV